MTQWDETSIARTIRQENERRTRRVWIALILFILVVGAMATGALAWPPPNMVKEYIGGIQVTCPRGYNADLIDETRLDEGRQYRGYLCWRWRVADPGPYWKPKYPSSFDTWCYEDHHHCFVGSARTQHEDNVKPEWQWDYRWRWHDACIGDHDTRSCKIEGGRDDR